MADDHNPAEGPLPHEILREMENKKQGQVSGDLLEQVIADNKRLRKAGNDLAIAALHVVKEYDGTHRLARAAAAWCLAVSDEGGRGERHDNSQRMP